MKQFFLICFFLSMLLNANVFGQRLKKPDKLKLADFSVANNIAVLYQRTYVSFLFKEDVSRGNVTDNQFKLSAEYILRIFLTKPTSSKDFQLLSKTYNVIPKIKSIDYYSLENNKIKKSDIENSLIKVEQNENVFYTNFSSLMKDSIAIIDLSYSIISDKKDSIVILNYNNIPLHDAIIIIDVPEIYTYSSLKSAGCLELETSTKQGFVRGYQMANSNAPVTGKAMADAFKIQFPKADYRPVYFKINSYNYTWTSKCSSVITPNILSLYVSRIMELK
jgi:hypothetical protein